MHQNAFAYEAWAPLWELTWLPVLIHFSGFREERKEVRKGGERGKQRESKKWKVQKGIERDSSVDGRSGEGRRGKLKKR